MVTHAVQTRLRDPEVLRNLRQRHLPLAGTATTSLRYSIGNALGMTNILPARTNLHRQGVNRTGGGPLLEPKISEQLMASMREDLGRRVAIGCRVDRTLVTTTDTCGLARC
jgi:hypothetical protein